jgi:SAM-dependent methyltransferase
MADGIRSVEECVIELFDHLGLEQAHIAAGRLVRGDWHGLATKHPERIASLTLISPQMLDPSEFAGLAARMLAVPGDQGPTAEGTTKFMAELPDATSHILRGYEYLPWSDLASDRGAEVGSAMLEFLDRFKSNAVKRPGSPEQRGEVAGISYRIRGAGPPVVLMPLDLAPAQWEPIIPQLSEKYCTLTLGGPVLGAVSLLEARGRSSYMAVVRGLLDAVQVRPGEAILEIGCGSGVVLREIVRRTAGANPITGIDLNPYLLREAMSLAAREGLADRFTLQEGHAEAIALPSDSVDVAISCTVMEEGNAERMLAEMVRVTKPGGRVAVTVRSLDIPWWVHPPLSPELRSKVSRPGLIGGDVTAGGCADASLYTRFHAAGLTQLRCFPQLVAVTPEFEPSRLASFEQRILSILTAEETTEWREKVVRAKSEGTFLFALPHHCAIGTKPH